MAKKKISFKKMSIRNQILRGNTHYFPVNQSQTSFVFLVFFLVENKITAFFSLQSKIKSRNKNWNSSSLKCELTTNKQIELKVGKCLPTLTNAGLEEKKQIWMLFVRSKYESIENNFFFWLSGYLEIHLG